MMNMIPVFSVVIPLYNKEAYIADTLQSVFRQNFSNFEIIVVDDGSTDNSLNIVRSFTDSRLRVYTKENGGVSSARNYGISKAQSEYIGLLDADDEWEPNFLEEMKKLIDKYPACGLYTSAYKRIETYKAVNYGTEVPEGVLKDFFQIKFQHGVPWTSATVVQKKVLDEVGGFPEGMLGGEDDYTWAKIAIKYSVAFTPKVLVLFNLIGSSYALRRGKTDHCKESWFDFYEEGNFYRNEFIANKLLYAGIRYAYNKNQNKSREIERLTRYNVLSKKLWWNLFFLNRVPLKVFLKWEGLLSNCKKAKHKTTMLVGKVQKSFSKIPGMRSA